jgi:nitrile hydratase subunit beta
MRSHHDMGGLPAGAVVASEHDYALWEKRVDALMRLLSPPAGDLLSTDELRRNIEALGPAAYDAMSYYERWMAGICATLLQRGAITADELGRRMAEIEAREAAPS